MFQFFSRIKTINLVKTTSDNICSGKIYTQQAKQLKGVHKYSESEINKAWKNAIDKRN